MVAQQSVAIGGAGEVLDAVESVGSVAGRDSRQQVSLHPVGDIGVGEGDAVDAVSADVGVVAGTAHQRVVAAEPADDVVAIGAAQVLAVVSAGDGAVGEGRVNALRADTGVFVMTSGSP